MVTELKTKIKLLKTRKKRLEELKKEIKEDIDNLEFEKSLTITSQVEIYDDSKIEIIINLPYRPTKVIRFSEIKVIAEALGLDDFEIYGIKMGFIIVC